MGLTFKRSHFNGKPTKIRKSEEEVDEILKLLRSFLDKEEPDLVYILVNTWRTQGRAITYKQLREAILAGELPLELFEEWQQDYARFVVKHLQPAWEKAMATAAAVRAGKYLDWHFDPMADRVISWTENRAAQFVTNSTQAQVEGLRALVQRAAGLEDMSVDQLARAIRPMVGLTKPQAVANLKYYENLIANGTSEKRAQDLAARYAARQHRARGYTIARTELATSYNQGAYEGIKQAQAAGYMGTMYKVWSTADDERVCSICGAIEKAKPVAMDDDFFYEHKDRYGNISLRRINPKLDSVAGKMPPAHPGCRCSVRFVREKDLDEI